MQYETKPKIDGWVSPWYNAKRKFKQSAYCALFAEDLL